MIVTEVISSGCTVYFIALEINFFLIEDKSHLCKKKSSLIMEYKNNENKNMEKCAKEMKN